MVDTENLQLSLTNKICGFVVDRVLVENQSWLVTGPGARQLVLKIIDPDCIVRGGLHPSVHDRLSRVRELAHASVANLIGVEREGESVYLIWEYVEGMTFDFFVGANRTPREVAAVARELALAIDLLHLQGIVHGALIGGNIIVAPGNVVRLTHISPLLYTDPSVDTQCLWDLLENAAEGLGQRGAALAALVSDSRQRNATPRQLAASLGELIDPREIKKTSPEAEQPVFSPRRRALVGAALAAVGGLAVAWGIWHAVEAGHFPHPDDNAHSPFHTQSDR